MKTKPRIVSILNAKQLDQRITRFPAFDLGDLSLPFEVSVDIPENLRLGHLVEKIVSQLFHLSTNYKVLYENTQLIKDKKTIGEIDYLIQEKDSGKITHLELAYKFYLYDYSISEIELNNWICPNRNDSLCQKLEKLKQKQFPLINHPTALDTFSDTNMNQVSQALCFLVSLFVPYGFQVKLSHDYKKAITGYYLNFEIFAKLSEQSKSYYLPTKKEWGIDPAANEDWQCFETVSDSMKKALSEKQSVLCWQKEGQAYQQFFVVWW